MHLDKHLVEQLGLSPGPLCFQGQLLENPIVNIIHYSSLLGLLGGGNIVREENFCIPVIVVCVIRISNVDD